VAVVAPGGEDGKQGSAPDNRSITQAREEAVSQDRRFDAREVEVLVRRGLLCWARANHEPPRYIEDMVTDIVWELHRDPAEVTPVAPE
jgi:hypothetical protein